MKFGSKTWGPAACLLDVKDTAISTTFNADGSRIAWRDMTQHVHVWDVDAAREVLTIPEPGGEVGQMVFSPDGTGALPRRSVPAR